ncbi:DUF262 domain-containing protein [Dyadobacter sp. 32]|uniref:DUF262 domain-containing protein n=1 Tax=Dyadobacter sp. 32 TaxID=538966 RepID=UPI0011EC24A3
MKFKIEAWTIKKILQVHKGKRLNLNPPYQRNNIWTEKSQKILISSIQNGMPIPTFFLHEKNDTGFDVADGQQRIRAILAFVNGEISDLAKNKFILTADSVFLKYEIPVVIIDRSVTEEEMREFYVMVNNTGMKLNKPEITKAKYFSSSVLTLVEELASSENFNTLGIFSEKQSDRMIDRDFVEELVALLYYGIGDKKNDVEKLYNAQLESGEILKLKTKFNLILDILLQVNSELNIERSRYVQRNDFYTLFKFLGDNLEISILEYKVFFDLLRKIQYDISPSNEKSPELQYYAFNCVSQSNSKTAREARMQFYNELLLNKTERPNKIQKALSKYYKISQEALIHSGTYYTLDPSLINTQFKIS